MYLKPIFNHTTQSLSIELLTTVFGTLAQFDKPPSVFLGSLTEPELAAEGGAGEAVAVGGAAAVDAPRVGEGVELLAAGPGPVPGVAGVLGLVPLIVNCNISFHSFNRAEMSYLPLPLRDLTSYVTIFLLSTEQHPITFKGF